MREKGLLTGFLLSKFGIALAVFLLIGSIMTVYKGFHRTALRREKKNIISTVTMNLRAADSSPSKARLEQKLPSLKRPYTLVLTGTLQDFQMIRVQVQGLENVQRTIFLNRKVNGGEFRIERKNPRKIIIKTSDQISLKVA